MSTLAPALALGVVAKSPSEAVRAHAITPHSTPPTPPHSGKYARGHSRSWQPGDGTFDLHASLRAVPYHECMPHYWAATVLLALLMCLHVIWYARQQPSSHLHLKPPLSPILALILVLALLLLPA